MTGSRRGPRPGGRLPIVVAAALSIVSLAEAGIEEKILGGQVTYVSRPSRKPADPSAAARRPIPGANTLSPQMLDLIDEVSRRHGLDPRLVSTVISVESAFNTLAVSPKGARGLMQLMPSTARAYGVANVHDPKENIEAGVAYLRDLLRRYRGDVRLALAAYNAGPEAVERASGVPNYPETIDYLRRIESRYGNSLAVSTMGSGGGTEAPAGAGSIQATRAEDGTVVVTNRRGPGVRVIRRGAGARR